ncbi:MAG TPA: GreA/GreB family elongation factor, partial [Candidatus Paceibacterota bacterium]
SDTANIGSVVKVQKIGDKEAKVYKIVGSEEADMASGKISNLSPIGSSILGKKEGEKFSFNTPKGEVTYSLISIE